MELCGMGQPDAERLRGYSCDYFCLLAPELKLEDRSWLGKLAACAEAEKADAVAAKLIMRQRFPLGSALSRDFIIYSGDDYTDAFGRVHANAGKPEWYKGCFNRNILQQNIKSLPSAAVLIRREELLRLIEDGWEADGDAKYVYEPGAVLFR